MPYINRDPQGTGADRRAGLLEEPLGSAGGECNGPGELNFAITALVTGYLGLVPEWNWTHVAKPGYKEFNEVIGALECAKQELYRRVIASYEDLKAKENGDVYC